MAFRWGTSLVVCSCAVLSVAVVVACGAVVQHSTTTTPNKPRPVPVLTKVSDVSASPASASAATRSLDLTQFRPLLAEPAMQQVATALDNEEYAEAAKTLSALLATQHSLDRLSEARARFVLGRVAEQAQSAELALVSYERATLLGQQLQWPLSDEARFRSARLQLTLGRGEQTLLELSQLKDQERPEVIELRAQAFGRTEQLKEAEASFSQLVSMLEPSSEAHHRALLGRAETLWALSQSAENAQQLKERATQDLGLAQLGLRPTHPIYLRVEELKRSYQVTPKVDSSDALLLAIEALIEVGAFDEAFVMAQAFKLPVGSEANTTTCRFAYLKGKILAGQRKWGEATETLAQVTGRCSSDPKLHASLLFNAGKYAAADGRDSAAVRYYEELETKYPDNSLADDARVRRAKSYQDMGSEARFVALLSQMPDDYPKGDMTMEGVLLLALDQMTKHKWSEAASLLERASSIVRAHDSERGHEYAGTERYFLARCLMELGEEERALSEYESLIRKVPLSYYMLHAYSRLLEADQARAKTALAESLLSARSAPFQFPYRPEYDSPKFQRAMEFLRVGELTLGRQALSELSDGQQADASLLWGIALLFDRAEDAHFSHQLARGRLTDWLAHYPEGDWQRPWEIGFPRPYLTNVEQESAATGVPPWLIYGIMREESTFVPDIVSPADAYGLMQVIPSTARGIGTKYHVPYSVGALKQPRYNIAIGSRVLAELGRRFKKNPLLAIPGYNAGPGRPGRWLSERPNIDFDLWVELIPIRETRRYTKRVLASRAAYAFTYYRDSSDAALVLPKRLNLN